MAFISTQERADRNAIFIQKIAHRQVIYFNVKEFSNNIFSKEKRKAKGEWFADIVITLQIVTIIEKWISD